VVTSFYQSLQAMSSFMHFPICATYCTLSRYSRSHRCGWASAHSRTHACSPSGWGRCTGRYPLRP